MAERWKGSRERERDCTGERIILYEIMSNNLMDEPNYVWPPKQRKRDRDRDKDRDKL